ncbi:hypothetical protein CC2G_002421 [Coprinopsis cinerea AmutBmut pab1-1]|nr:hypothetical protein CC2G_002421 [Coprinopsis cinerea AmutBmut pab1-1]
MSTDNELEREIKRVMTMNESNKLPLLAVLGDHVFLATLPTRLSHRHRLTFSRVLSMFLACLCSVSLLVADKNSISAPVTGD